MIELKDAPKLGDGNLSRVVPPSETYQHIRPLMAGIGISHVVEITSLDILGIPVFVGFGSEEVESQLKVFTEHAPEAIRTKMKEALVAADRFQASQLTNSKKPIFVAGKGLTPLDAKVSVMMEAIERYSARNPSCQPCVGSYREMLRKGDWDVLDPHSLVLLSPESFDGNQPLEWVSGTRLGDKEEIWVPADAATFSYQPLLANRVCSDTPTGLGAGNTLEEAVSHGLAEAIEHDSWTLAIVRSSLANARSGILDLMFGNTSEKQASLVENISGSGEFVRLDLNTIESIPSLAGLIHRIRQAGAKFNIYWITTDLGIPTFSVSIEGLVPGLEGGGLGTHPDVRIAIARALTEAAQQRLVIGASSYFPKAQLISRWQTIPWEKVDDAEHTCQYGEVESNVFCNILDDIQHMLRRLEAQGLDQVIVVDLTKPEFNVPVVKVIVPGLADYWTDKSPPDWMALGPRVRQYINY